MASIKEMFEKILTDDSIDEPFDKMNLNQLRLQIIAKVKDLVEDFNVLVKPNKEKGFTFTLRSAGSESLINLQEDEILKEVEKKKKELVGVLDKLSGKWRVVDSSIDVTTGIFEAEVKLVYTNGKTQYGDITLMGKEEKKLLSLLKGEKKKTNII